MATVLVATATTNTTPGSIVQVQVEDLVCSLTVQPNIFGDSLPIIPTSSRTENNKVLYQVKLKARLIQHAGGQAAGGHILAITSSRAADRILSTGIADVNGEILFTVETRIAGRAEFTSMTEGVTLPPFQLNFKEAWYQSDFLITGYNVCAEEDFSGGLVEGNGLDEKHKEDFLFGAAGIPMQGTGRAANGLYIRLQSMDCPWHLNATGHPDRVQSHDSVTFSYADAVIGAYNPVTQNHSIAVDSHVIPKRAREPLIYC